MAVKVLMPKLGLTMKRGKIAKWIKQEGQEVTKGEDLLEIITEKITNVMEAPASGVLYKILAEKGRNVPVTVPIAVIAEPGDDETALQQVVEEAQVELDSSEAKDTKKKTTEKETKKEVQPIRVDGTRKISPRALRLAQEKGIDIDYVIGTGPNGRVTEKDVNNYLQELDKEKQPEVIPFEGMRGIIAERMSESSRNAARVTIMQEVDITNLQDLREKINNTFQEQGKGKVSYTDLIAVAVARALKEHPVMNARVSAEEIELCSSVNLGIAVALEDGLIVPVVHQAHRLSLLQMSEKIKSVAERARSGELDSKELQGGTFTITNLGMFGAEGFTPIINPPETAILGIGTITEKPALKDGNLERRTFMTMSLSFDHRAVDGAPAAQFLSRVKEILEDPHPLFQMEGPNISRPLAAGGGKDPNKLMQDFVSGIEWLNEEAPDIAVGFNSLMAPVFAEGELSTKEKELIAVALSVYIKCEYCISHHVHNAVAAGAEPDEILEAAGVAVAFGGGPAMAYTVTLVKECIKAFCAE